MLSARVETLEKQVASLLKDFKGSNNRVEALEKQVDVLTSKVDALLELANKSKGGFWMGMTIASMLGAVVAWVIDHLLIK
ncbi:MAG: hypothetical protein ACK559_35985 [bacterium]